VAFKGEPNPPLYHIHDEWRVVDHELEDGSWHYYIVDVLKEWHGPYYDERLIADDLLELVREK
jgi:hypothetical protein